MASYKLTHSLLHTIHEDSHKVRMENDTAIRRAFSPVTTNPRVLDDTDLSEWVNDAYDAARTAYEATLQSINDTEQLIAREIIT